MQRFFLNPDNFTPDRIIITDRTILHQTLHVLRMKIGDEFIALDGNGYEFICSIQCISDLKLEAIITAKRKNPTAPKIILNLFQALPKKQSLFELILQKGTELGVGAFHPLITERTERHSISKIQRFSKILKEAAEQSERGKMPQLALPLTLQDALNKTNNHKDISILLHGRGNFPLLSSQLDSIRNFPVCNLFIGPEGGFSDKEISLAQENNVKICSLGFAVLRTETAAIAAASLILL